MKKIFLENAQGFFLIGFSLLGIFLSACGAPVTKERVTLEWPFPPDPPRIAYEQSLSSIRDLEPAPSFFRRLGNLLFGKEEVPVLVRPFSLCAEGGKLYVGDTGLQVVHIFNLKTKEYKQVFRLKDPYRILSPVGVTVDSKGNLFVSDSEWNKIFVFNPEGKFLREFVEEGEVGRVAGIVYNPLNDFVYVSDTVDHRVVAYSLEGKKQFQFGHRGGQAGSFNFPTHLAVNKVSGEIYVTDSMNFRVQHFGPDGKFLSTFGSLGRTIGSFSKPKGVALDTQGLIYVVDGIYDTVQLFNAKGALLMNFGISGIKPGQFWLPAGIAIDEENRIFVADTFNFRVQIFKFLDSSG
ncbi:MAG TPA: 6-bladed beta-propeller [Nitrospiria bacterium]|jgi:DNA-binding beta-propeller fold protein YncE